MGGVVQVGRIVEDCAGECDLRVKACLCSQSAVDWCSHPLAPVDLVLGDEEEPPPECPLRQAPFLVRLHEKFLDKPQRDPFVEVAEQYQWRDAAREQPPKYERVLIRLSKKMEQYLFDLRGGFEIGYFVPGNGFDSSDRWEANPGSPIAHVAYWMPLPKPLQEPDHERV